jgi:hypothetical protein
MCNISLVIGLILAAEAATLVTLVLLLAATATSSNPFTSGASPGLLIAGLAAVLIAVGAVSAAVVHLGSCLSGPCGSFARLLQVFLGGLIGTLTVIAVAIAVGIVPSAIPFAGSVVVAALAIAVGLTGILWPVAAEFLRRLDMCRGLGRLSIGGSIVVGVAILILLVSMYASLSIGFPAKPVG